MPLPGIVTIKNAYKKAFVQPGNNSDKWIVNIDSTDKPENRHEFVQQKSSEKLSGLFTW